MIEADEVERRKRLIATWANREVDLLSSVTARARPAAGESGAIADAVAGMARRAANAAAIADIEQATDFLESVVEYDTYALARPEPPTEFCRRTLERFDREWSTSP